MSPVFKKVTFDEAKLYELGEYQDLIRSRWMASSLEERRYFEHHLRHRLFDALERQARDSIDKAQRDSHGCWTRAALSEGYARRVRALPIVAFESAIERLEDIGEHTLICGNRECKTPYFIANRRSQKYCSLPCAAVFQQQAKREWWQEHGDVWRAERQEKDRRTRSGQKKA
jgi:hypothetical protein